ncbi:MAG: ANTAR domain-containing protein [Mycobacterium sp.]|nr:ANTAR domain-containing protein [Mycobacterium sp.]
MTRARTLHLAEGILIGLRRCSPEQAIAELVAAGRAAGLSTFALARGLVIAAGGHDSTDPDPASQVAEQRWGTLFPQRDTPGPYPATEVSTTLPTSMA